MSSNIGNLQGGNANKFFNADLPKGEVVHIKLDNLGPNVDEVEIRRTAGVKHVIASDVEVDALKGTCKGKGSIQIRLNEGENKEAIAQKFVNKGWIVQDHKVAPQKDTTFTRPIY